MFKRSREFRWDLQQMVERMIEKIVGIFIDLN